VRVLLIDETVAVVVDAVAGLVGPGVYVGVVVVAVVVGGITVAVVVIGALNIHAAGLALAVAALLGRAGEGVRIVIIAVERQSEWVATVVVGDGKAIAIGVAGHSVGAGGGGAAVARCAVAVSILRQLLRLRDREGWRGVGAQPAQGRRHRAAAFHSLE